LAHVQHRNDVLFTYIADQFVAAFTSWVFTVVQIKKDEATSLVEVMQWAHQRGLEMLFLKAILFIKKKKSDSKVSQRYSQFS